MLNGFDTGRADAAAAASLVHPVYVSRDPGRLKVDMDFWGRVERGIKSSAKRARTLGEFVEHLKKVLGCSSIRAVKLEDGLPRYFHTAEIDRPAAPEKEVLRCLARETSFVMLLVRERVERDRAERKLAGLTEDPTNTDDLETI